MKKIPFDQVRFFTSALNHLPELQTKDNNPMLEVVLAGRSNVGKSSLINHLFCQKKLAKVSGTPGKTQTINFFIVDEELALVDLPGYGFAKRSKEAQENWAGALENYFQSRKTLALILLLIDIRREPTEEDMALIEWAEHYKKPLLIVFTKSDTLPNHERKQVRNHPSIYYSIKDPKSRKALIGKVNSLCR